MSTPFSDFKATEISFEKQAEYFVEPKHISKLISPKASIIIGERGSGKTTILRYLENHFNHSDVLEYIGVYYRFETAYMRALYNPELTEDKNIEAFSQTLIVVISKLLCDTIQKIKEEKEIVFEHETELCRELAKNIDCLGCEEVTTWQQLANLLEKIRKKIMINLQNEKYICYLEYTTFLFELCEGLRKENLFHDTCVCVLLDEYENLNYSEQRVVNSLIKASSTILTFKVCMRPDGFLTQNTVAEKEQLIVGHDYEEINFVEEIVGKEKDVQEHFRKICENRLKYFYKQKNVQIKREILGIDHYLEIVKEEEEFKTWPRISEYQDKLKTAVKRNFSGREQEIDSIESVIDLRLLLILKQKRISENKIFDNVINHTETYKNWLHNYKYNTIFKIISECEQEKKYCGFDTFIKLANNNARIVLEILHYAFGDYEEQGEPYPLISIYRQTEAVNRVSEQWFDQVAYIPVNGYKTKNLVNSLGNLFETFLQDDRARKFETNSFSIKNTQLLQEGQREELKEVLRDSVVWGVLIPHKSNKKKNKGDIVFDDRDFVLHPVFAPFFKISYRKRQKCELKDIDVYAMLEPLSRKDLKSISNKIDNQYTQLELEFK